jgi:mono/diheme cytochrome c family protein
MSTFTKAVSPAVARIVVAAGCWAAANVAAGAAPASIEPATTGSTASNDVAPASDGAALFITHCASCHGTLGAGDGELAPSLSVVLQDLRYLTARNEGVFPRDFVVKIIDGRITRAAHGPADMPVWGAVFAAGDGAGAPGDATTANARVEALADFLQAIQRTDSPAP